MNVKREPPNKFDDRLEKFKFQEVYVSSKGITVVANEYFIPNWNQFSNDWDDDSQWRLMLIISRVGEEGVIQKSRISTDSQPILLPIVYCSGKGLPSKDEHLDARISITEKFRQVAESICEQLG